MTSTATISPRYPLLSLSSVDDFTSRPAGGEISLEKGDANQNFENILLERQQVESQIDALLRHQQKIEEQLDNITAREERSNKHLEDLVQLCTEYQDLAERADTLRASLPTAILEQVDHYFGIKIQTQQEKEKLSDPSIEDDFLSQDAVQATAEEYMDAVQETADQFLDAIIIDAGEHSEIENYIADRRVLIELDHIIARRTLETETLKAENDQNIQSQKATLEIMFSQLDQQVQRLTESLREIDERQHMQNPEREIVEDLPEQQPAEPQSGVQEEEAALLSSEADAQQDSSSQPSGTLHSISEEDETVEEPEETPDLSLSLQPTDVDIEMRPADAFEEKASVNSSVSATPAEVILRPLAAFTESDKAKIQLILNNPDLVPVTCSKKICKFLEENFLTADVEVLYKAIAPENEDDPQSYCQWYISKSENAAKMFAQLKITE